MPVPSKTSGGSLEASNTQFAMAYIMEFIIRNMEIVHG
jgi:hypothetical protein